MHVLTSTWTQKPTTDGEVYRWLTTDVYRCEGGLRTQVATTSRPVPARCSGGSATSGHSSEREEFKPDPVLLNLAHVSVSVALWAQYLGLPTCFWLRPGAGELERRSLAQTVGLRTAPPDVLPRRDVLAPRFRHPLIRRARPRHSVHQPLPEATLEARCQWLGRK